jgi:5-dehydro-2-deoxygluconokinase
LARLGAVVMQRLWDRMRLARFLVLGRVGMDLYADPPGTRIEEAARYVSAIGGSAGNIAAALARQGVEVGLLSCVSDDAVGRYCRTELAQYGVSTAHVRSVAGGVRTSLAVTETRSNGCQTVLYRNGAADFDLTEADVTMVDFAPLAALVVTGTALAAQPSRAASFLAIKQAKAAGALVVLDIDYRAYSWASRAEAAETCLMAARQSNIVVGNDEEFDLLAQGTDGLALARRIARETALLVIYKKGAAGSVTVTADYEFVTGIYPVTALKPTGAGDGFMGGLLAGLAKGHTLDAAVRRGSATAAMIVSGIGCAPASPDSPALETFLAQH